MYRHQQSGLTARALVYEHADREASNHKHGLEGLGLLKRWNEEDFATERRFDGRASLFITVQSHPDGAEKGQLQTAAHLMDSLGRSCW